MRATIQLTQLANKNAVLKALITVARDHAELQQNLITTGFRFDSLSPATVAALKQKLDDLRHPSYTLSDRAVTILADDNSLNGLFKVILAILQTEDNLARTLWTQGLIIQNLSQSLANILKRQLEAESARVTISADDNARLITYTVQGTVSSFTGAIVPNLTIRVFHLQDNQETSLGETRSNSRGAYTLSYSWDDTSSIPPNLVVRGYDQGDRAIGEARRTPARPQETVDLVVDYRDQPQENPFTVKGIVRQADESPMAGVTVQALDIDFRAEELLGEAITNLDGAYQITYTADQFANAENKSADLMIRVIIPTTGQVLGTSDIRFNAGREETINLTLTPPTPPDLSEYERLVAALLPVVGDVPFATFTDEDTAFLAGETGQDRQRIEILRLSALLTNETSLPTYVFYGFARRGLSLELDPLLSQDSQILRDALLATIEERIIPDIRADLDDILAAIEQLKLGQGTLVNYSLLGQLTDQETEAPVVGFTVRGFLLDPAGNPVDLGQDITQVDGQFTLSYTAPRLPADTEESPQQAFRLEIATPAGDTFHETDITLPIGQTDPVIVPVSVPAEPDPSPTVNELTNSLGLELSPPLKRFLRERNLNTLADIRTAGGLQFLEGAPDDLAVATLDAHANLDVLSTDSEQNQMLIDRRYGSIQDIAGTTQADFVHALADAVDDEAAAQIHTVARAEVDVLNNILTHVRAEVGNGFPSPLPQGSDDGSDPVTELLTETCQCRNCDAAVSPLAYLADLLDYATTHLKNGTQALTIPFLETTFEQPFGDLPTACDSLEQQVRQIRLCIEVLRGYLATNPPSPDQQTALAKAESTYRIDAYTTLLNQIGTSYAELRASRSAEEPDRQSLATQLGLHPDRLNALFFDPDTLSEYDLEQRFGLVDTSRDRLSEGAKTGDEPAQLTRWNFDGVAWNHNTDSDGNLYISVRRSDVTTLVVYRDRDRTQRIASGSRSSTKGTINLLPENNSDLSGSVEIDYQADTPTIEISVIPDLLSWQLQQLRDRWQQLDWPTGDNNTPTENQDPIVDPDWVGPADLRDITPQTPVLDLWQARRDQLDAEYEALKQARETSGDNLDPILTRDEIGLSIDALDTLAADQASGQDITADLEALHLTRAGFAYLQQMRRLVAEPAPILASEWADCYAVLVQVFKRQQLETWRNQEETLNGESNPPLILSPDDFTLLDKALGEIPQPKTVPSFAWQRMLRDRRDWQSLLQSRIDQEQTMISGLHEAISTTEEFTLSALREALIEATPADGITQEAKAKWVRDRLLIETQVNSCQQTTRLAQAIETLQILIWSVRTGQIQDTYPDLTLDADNFEEEWQWLGSYTSWRSAMFVFLYPEIILRPQLRRWQTPAFQTLVEELRNNRRLTPVDACRAAERYSQYFEDICKLRLEASVIARTKTYEDDRCQQTFKGDRHLIYLFAMGGATNTVYVSWYDPKDETAYAQSFWEPIPGLENVRSIVGAAAYTISSAERFIYLFIRVGDESKQKLVYTTYDLEQAQWSNETIELDLPEDARTFTAVVKQSNRNARLQLAIRISNGAIYTRQLNREGTGWEDGDWYPTVGRAKGKEFSELLAMIEPAPGQFYLFTRHIDQLSYRLFGKSDDGIWDDVGFMRGAWLGGFALFGTKRVYSFWRVNSGSAVRYQSFQGEDIIYRVGFWNNFTQFDNWLKDVTGVSLSELFVEGGNQYSGMSLLDLLTLNPEDDPHQSTVGSTIYKKPDESELEKQIREKIEQERLAKYYRNSAESHINQIDGQIENSSDQFWKDWRLADNLVRQFTTPSNSLTQVLKKLLDQVPAAYKERNRNTEKSTQRPGASGLERILYPAGEWPSNLQFLLTYKRTIQSTIGDIFEARSNLAPRFNSDLNDILAPSGSRIVFNRAIFIHSTDHRLTETSALPVAPTVTEPFAITEKLTEAELQKRRSQIKRAFGQNQTAPASVLTYLEEAWYYVPICVAQKLKQRRQFTAALDWFRTVYDYSVPIEQRKIYYGLKQEETLSSPLQRNEDWLLDPLNPHAIATSRKGTYTRFTLLSLIQCFLEFADAEFTRDTAESLPRARTLYSTALELLDLPELKQNIDTCNDITISIDIDLAGDTWDLPQLALRNELSRLSDTQKLKTVAAEVQAALQSNQPIAERVATAKKLVQQALAEQRQSPPLRTAIAADIAKRSQLRTVLLKNPVVAKTVKRSGKLTATDFSAAATAITNRDIARSSTTNGQGNVGSGRDLASTTSLVINNLIVSTTQLQAIRKVGRGFFPVVSYSFCIPPNPILRGLKLQAEVNLFKLQNCRNIAGDERESLSYSAPTDLVSGLPLIGASGKITLPNTNVPESTPYRYEFLIERAKQLVQLAAQIEANFLSALEKRDGEYYTLMKSRQETQLSYAGRQLQFSRVEEAKNGENLANLQQVKNQIEFDYYTALIGGGKSNFETARLRLLESVAVIKYLAATANFIAATTPSLTSVFSFGASNAESYGKGLEQLASALDTTSQILSIYADYERREQGWKFQRDLAQRNILIGKQQVELSRDRVRIVGQEYLISEMQSDFAESTAEFLANKFTNADLYDWMSNILEGVYSFFLQQATAVAKLAEQQLAFERQETTPSIIQPDYWVAQTDDLPAVIGSSEVVDRRGLTGSARLLADIFNLDQYRFATERRKLQLTKTISLAQLAPTEFQSFRETGVLPFETPMSLFDQDFPGHYLRRIKNVSTSLIALSPPGGISVTLSKVGLTTQVVVNRNGGFEVLNLSRAPEYIARSPESVALSSPREATGLFELTPQPQELLLPFEGLGVGASWEFRMPKPANQFDYSTIADVLITIDYTALDSSVYRQQVIQELDRTTSGDRAFSFRNQFADQWFDLNNPDQTATPMTVTFETRRADFPPNLEELGLKEVVFYFARAEGETVEINVEYLKFTEKQTGQTSEGSSAETQDGIISTASGKAPVDWDALVGKSLESPKSPIGEWELALSNTEAIRAYFQDEEIEDILFVITYQGRTPPWPA